MTEKRLTLNSEKRKAIGDVFQDHFEQTSPKYEQHKKSIADYNTARTKMKVLAETVVRHHQPQEDVDTIRSMIKKYSSSGGAFCYGRVLGRCNNLVARHVGGEDDFRDGGL